MIIGFCGKAGSGKDASAEFLLEVDTWRKYAFASPLKKGISVMFNIPLEHTEDNSIRNEPNYKFGRSLRYLMQTIGTEWGRNIVSEDVWVKMAEENIQNLVNEGYNVVMTDIRFDNEADMIRRMGGKIIKVVRPDNKINEDVLNSGNTSHASETGISDEKVDYIIDNSGNLNYLYTQVVNIICDTSA